MKAVLKAAFLGLALSIAAAWAWLAIDIVLLGNFDPKLGPPWDNFTLGAFLFAEAILVETAVLALVGAVAVRVSRAHPSPWVAAVAMASLNFLAWPPWAMQPLLVAVLVGVGACAAGFGGAWLANVVTARRAARVAGV